MTREQVLASCLTIFLVVLPIVAFSPFASAQSGTNVIGIISSDATWTKTNGPYSLTGNVLISSGTTITVAAGTTVDLNGFYLTVNGSLIIEQGAIINLQKAGHIKVNGMLSAIGTNTNPVLFNGFTVTEHIMMTYTSEIDFSISSTEWNTQTSLGSTIQHAVLNVTSVQISNSVKISDNTLNGAGVGIAGGSPIISNNIIGGSLGVTGGSPTILSNSISGLVTFGNFNISKTSEPNGTVLFENNVVSDNQNTYFAITISGYSLNYNLKIANNLIQTNNQAKSVGIDFYMYEDQNCPVTITNNIITNSEMGIRIVKGIPQSISNNNIYNNQFNVKLFTNSNLDAANNWWGSSDQHAINQSIYDTKNDYNLGTVNFLPFLTQPNPNAGTNNIPTTTPENTTVSPSPTIPEYPTTTILTIILVTTIATVIITKTKRTKK